MKKPKINLKTIHTGHQFIDVEGVSSLMVCNAYSEMIDTLIKVRQAYQGVVDFEGTGQNLMKLIPEIDKALKKAGCSDD